MLNYPGVTIDPDIGFIHEKINKANGGNDKTMFTLETKIYILPFLGFCAASKNVVRNFYKEKYINVIKNV